MRSRFNITSNMETEIHYNDEVNDRITVTYDDEFQIALKNDPPSKFELIIKSNLRMISNYDKDERDRIIRAKLIYGERLFKLFRSPIYLYGNVGDYNEIRFKSRSLTLNNL